MEKTEIVRKLSQILSNSAGVEDVLLEHPADEKFGDYSTNIAMVLAKKEGKNPRDLANSLVEKIGEIDFVEKVEVAGAGFINFFIKPEILVAEVQKYNFENIFEEQLRRHGKGKTMLIDYSAPNIAKPFGIGHLRSTNIGQAIYNIYKVLGWNCIGDNHLGDWGTQFGKLIVAIKKWNSKKVEDLSIADLEKLYIKFHNESEKDESLIEEGRVWFAKLEAGDSEARDIWQKCVEISLREFNKVYAMLGVKIDNALGESFYADKMEAVAKMLDDKKILKVSQGAKIVEFPDIPPAIVIKSNGTTTYFLRDLATIKYRMETWQPDLIVYEVGADQELYFRQLFATAKKLGWNPEFYHVAHGLIRWKDGKFSTRKGNSIHLEEVIDEAKKEARKIAPENSEEKLTAVAIGAIKFNDLSQDPKKDIIFDWEKMMSMDGDSGPYLQYTYARCMSVLSKTEIVEQKDILGPPSDFNQEEIKLVKELAKFEEKMIESADRFSPAVLAEFLLSVSRKYNEFYAKHRIIGEKEEVWRIFLTRTTASSLKFGLNLLGIETIEKM